VMLSRFVPLSVSLIQKVSLLQFVFFLASSADGVMTNNTVLMGCTGWFGESARRIILEENHFIATGFNMSEGSGLNVLGNGLPSVKDNALLRNVDIGNRELTHTSLVAARLWISLLTHPVDSHSTRVLRQVRVLHVRRRDWGLLRGCHRSCLLA